MVVELTVPPLWVNVTLEVKPLPEVVDTSNPVGGVTTILAERLEPLTVKLCWVDAVPAHAVNAESVPEVDTVGADTTSVKLLAALTQVVVLFLTVATKLYVLAALAGMVTLIGDTGKLVLLTAVKLGMAVGEPVVIEYWLGLPVVAEYGKLKLVAEVLTPVTEPKVIVGNTFTVPLADTFCVVAPVEAQAILPEGVPLAALVKRT
jgi:hypothetical protein